VASFDRDRPSEGAIEKPESSWYFYLACQSLEAPRRLAVAG
jgi:hypothetical protein